MKRHFFPRLIMFLPLICLMIVPVYSETSDVDLRLTAVSGDVYVRARGADDDGWTSASEDTPLESGDVIKTVSGASAEVAIGGDTVVLLDENTELKADSLTSRLTRFFLRLGSITAKIKSLSNSDDQFQVQTPVMVASVRGTEFAVTSQGDELPTVVGVFDEGKVEVETPQGTTQLAAGEETEILRGAPPIPKRPLRHFEPMRPRMEHARERAQTLRVQWRALPPQQRQDLRQRRFSGPRVNPEMQQRHRQRMKDNRRDVPDLKTMPGRKQESPRAPEPQRRPDPHQPAQKPPPQKREHR